MIQCNTFSLAVHEGQIELSLCITLLSRFQIPLGSLYIVL